MPVRGECSLAIISQRGGRYWCNGLLCYTALHLACRRVTLRSAMALIEGGQTLVQGTIATALHLHVRGHTEIAMALIDRGRHYEEQLDWTALHLHVENEGHIETAMAPHR
jgi:hypothetical protein